LIEQTTLDGKGESSAIPSVCCEACFYATGEKCVCSCGGVFHGIGTQTEKEDWTLNPEQSKPFYDKIKDYTCSFCGSSLKGVPISYYPHDAGWTVSGLVGKFWLYLVCPKCGYQWALWKLGVKKE
jgi:hypothetical protein